MNKKGIFSTRNEMIVVYRIRLLLTDCMKKTLLMLSSMKNCMKLTVAQRTEFIEEY